MKGSRIIQLAIAMALVPGGCQQSRPSDSRLAERIERHVEVAHPSLNLKEYARFYAHGPDRTVYAIYVDARIDGRSGETRWASQEELPIINDAGCGVVTTEYDVASDTLRSSRCG